MNVSSNTNNKGTPSKLIIFSKETSSEPLNLVDLI